jgi:hypothetical protein
MKPSELKTCASRSRERTGKTYPMSRRADPPISAIEAEMARVAICCWHGGLIKTFGDKDGRVFFCPTGNQYWRYMQKGRTLWRRLPPMPRRGINV